jgi:hypothetical protein
LRVLTLADLQVTFSVSIFLFMVVHDDWMRTRGTPIGNPHRWHGKMMCSPKVCLFNGLDDPKLSIMFELVLYIYIYIFDNIIYIYTQYNQQCKF